MNPIAITKETMRLASTHGLSKDVIDLMEKKLALLTDEMASLADENKTLKTENMNLNYKLGELQKKSSSVTHLPEGFDETTERIIAAMFSSAEEVSMEGLSKSLQLPLGMIQFHFDAMSTNGFVRKTYPGIRLGSNHQPARYVLDSAGLRYAASKNSS